jgi:hypothetical protein
LTSWMGSRLGIWRWRVMDNDGVLADQHWRLWVAWGVGDSVYDCETKIVAGTGLKTCSICDNAWYLIVYYLIMAQDNIYESQCECMCTHRYKDCSGQQQSAVIRGSPPVLHTSPAFIHDSPVVQWIWFSAIRDWPQWLRHIMQYIRGSCSIPSHCFWNFNLSPVSRYHTEECSLDSKLNAILSNSTLRWL